MMGVVAEQWFEGKDGRRWRPCSCPAGPDPHTRERVPGAPVEMCYLVNQEEKVIDILKIETMPE